MSSGVAATGLREEKLSFPFLWTLEWRAPQLSKAILAVISEAMETTPPTFYWEYLAALMTFPSFPAFCGLSFSSSLIFIHQGVCPLFSPFLSWYWDLFYTGKTKQNKEIRSFFFFFKYFFLWWVLPFGDLEKPFGRWNFIESYKSLPRSQDLYRQAESPSIGKRRKGT